MVDVGDGVELWTASDGVGSPVVLCHGGPGGVDNLGAVSEMLVDSARVHRYEQRACGRSSGGAPFTMSAAVRDLDALRAHWGYERWIVAGHSFGAALALAYAIEHPGATEAVAGVSCMIRLADQPDWFQQYRLARQDRLAEPVRERFLELRRLRDRLGGLPPELREELIDLSIDVDFGDPLTAQRLRPALKAEMSAANWEVNKELGADFIRYFAQPEIAQRLEELDIPVLLVHGDADPRPLAAAEALAGRLRHPRLVELDGVGHMPFLESPMRLRDILRDFLNLVE